MGSIVGWGLKDGNRLARTVGRELRDPNNYSNLEFIEAAQRALKNNPDEWVIHYSLADKCQAEGFYSVALESARKCVELKPQEIRSTYALATTYYILTRADWSEKEIELSKVFRMLTSIEDKLDPKYSQAGLDYIGITVDIAATQAIRWFERSLSLKPDNQSLQFIKSHLHTLYSKFPNLES